MDHRLVGQMAFVTAVLTPGQQAGARLLVDSLRTFGGPLCDCPVWILEMRPQAAPCGDLAGPGIYVMRLEVPEAFPRYYFTYKVYAWAQAEEWAEPSMQSLVWLNPECLVLRPPMHFELAPPLGAAFRPVHIRNVGNPAGEALDLFWQGVYRAVGLDAAGYTVESYVDTQKIRPYYNTHLFALAPGLGIGRAWLQAFETLVQDEAYHAYQATACADELHQIFLHQAVLSALLAKQLGPERIRVLPAEYSYPLHLHGDVPLARQPRSLNQLVCPVYEGAFHYPETLAGLEVEEPLAAWLREQATSHE
jgi:hypothetical protein